MIFDILDGLVSGSLNLQDECTHLICRSGFRHVLGRSGAFEPALPSLVETL